MASRQDQLHSYQFMMQRVISAIVMRETDPPRSPFRRITSATLAGALLAALGIGGALAYGLIVPGGSGKWKNPKAVIVEKESGAVFVYRADDKKLHPALNLASALLAVEDPAAARVFVSHRSLNDVPRGHAIGIADAPASLPPAKQLNHDPWTICSDRSSDGPVRSVLFVAGGGGTGGRALKSGKDARPVMIATTDGAKYVIIGRYRHLVRDPEILLPRLVWIKQPITVSPAFLNALPAGADLARIAPSVQRFGEPSKKLPGKIGQVYSVRRPADDGRDYFVGLSDGLASLTPLQMELMLADPLTASKIGRTEPTDLDRNSLAQFGPNLPEFLPARGAGPLPAGRLNLDETQQGAICATVHGPKGADEVRVEVTLPELKPALVTAARGKDGAVYAERVVVRPGYGVLVLATSSERATSGTVSLITDTGRRYAIPRDAVLSVLGYRSAKVIRMPSELVALLPPGPALEPERARQPAILG